MRQILWGLFKKIVIADNLGYYVNDIYHRYAALDGIELGLGTVYFAFQIYCDFSGYSDIAIGSARLFGFNADQKFCLSVFFPGYRRFLAPLAYHALHLVSGLSLRAAWRQPGRSGTLGCAIFY